MTPVMCMVRHNPPHSYGDCVRACIASLLSMPAEHVPHFYHDDCDGLEGVRRIREFLKSIGYGVFTVQYSGEAPLSDVLAVMNDNCPAAYYMLFGSNSGGNHVVICQNDQIVHDPNWYKMPIIGPLSTGAWAVMVLVKL